MPAACWSAWTSCEAIELIAGAAEATPAVTSTATIVNIDTHHSRHEFSPCERTPHPRLRNRFSVGGGHTLPLSRPLLTSTDTVLRDGEMTDCGEYFPVRIFSGDGSD